MLKICISLLILIIIYDNQLSELRKIMLIIAGTFFVNPA